MKGMILAAGKGTRIKPISYAIPKPMVPILGKPVMESMIQLFAKHGIDKIVVNTSHLAEIIENYFGDGHHFNVQLSYSYEAKEVDGEYVSQALGSAGGMRKIQDFSGFFDETFVVVCGDAWIDLDLKEAVEHHKKHGGIATIITKEVDSSEVSKYGVVVTDKYNQVTSFQEKPAESEALSNNINTGIYIFEPAIFDFIPRDIEFDIGSDLFPLLVERQANFYAINMDFQWLDVGKVKDVWEVTSDIISGKVKGYPIPGTQVSPGVWLGINTRVDTSKCNITPPVIISSGSEVQDGATIIGPVVIGANCKVEAKSLVSNTLICDYIHLADDAYIVNKTMFGDYLLGHDGYTQLLTECQYVHILKNRNVSRPIGGVATIDNLYKSTPIPHDILAPLQQVK
ncbi:NTP transferase domain-containing protein [Shewanella schlegeliana]|uniref:NTP transferase domain-containing protein n=1 Tax=Shewanella schlegeliana TaxID=190308 RepID=A0ABS1T592_9GAMM|nr:sugar phosphate nucleotidyltransferase [Shewanella schlegeliana]MBL4915002.1 NTP transferase domain-containing protein [Shewanella schlegeliana]MCL1110586.1 NTP transferase domain-containing protein [Shewanella schlegeliana]GIU32207.1 mannose-1-phosphate guanylyltransferase [Shewanella schlegeliana]